MARQATLASAVLALACCGTTAGLGQTVTLNTVEYVGPTTDAVRIGAYGPAKGCTSPSQLVFGTLPTGDPVWEVAVVQHVLHPGEVVPLPHYADGVEANETEVFWTAHIWEAKFPHWVSRYALPATTTSDGDRVTVSFSGRTYNGGYMIFNPYTFPNFETRDIDVAVTVVAARKAVPTGAGQSSWGALKAKER